MPDVNAMSTFEKYVQGLSLLTTEQLTRCKNAQQQLRQLGIPKTLEELTLRMGVLEADRLSAFLKDIKDKWDISVPRPVLTSLSDTEDRELQEKLVRQSPDGAAQVLECRELREKAAKLGVALKVCEILVAKGYSAPASSGPASAAAVPADPEAVSAEISMDDLLPDLPPPKPEPEPFGPRKLPSLRKGPGVLSQKPGAKPIRPAPAQRGTKPAEREVEAPPLPKKAPNPKLTFWIGIGAAGAVFVVAIVLLIVSWNRSSPPPPEPVVVRPEEKSAKKPSAPGKSSFDLLPPTSVRKDPTALAPAPKPAEKDFIPNPLAKDSPKTAPVPDPKPVAEPEPAKPAPETPKADPAPAPTAQPDTPEPPKVDPAKPEPSAPPPEAKPGADGKAPRPPGDPARDAREKAALALWTQAETLEKDNKLVEAQDKLRELRTRYRSTRIYFDRMIELTDKINELGQKIAAAALVKTSFYKRPHMDSWWSFEFIPPEGWKGVPSQPNLVGEQDNDESFYKGRTYQMARYNAPYLDKLYIVILKTFACTGLDNLESKVIGELDLRYKGLKEESKLSAAGKMPYLRKTYVSNDGDRLAAYFFYGDRKGIALVGVWRAGGDGLYISITTVGPAGSSTRKTSDHPVSEADFSAAVKVFDQSAKNFVIYDAAARAGKRVQLEMGSLCSDWSTIKSSKGNYIVEYATRPDFAKRAGEEMEQIQALYRHVIPTQKPIPPCRIKIFDREEEFKDYSLALGAAAYWSPMQEEIVAYRFEGDKLKLDSKEEFTLAEEKNPEDVTFKVLYHEGFHQYMHFYMGRARNIYVPSWLNEGMGDYFFGGDWNKNRSKFTLGVNDWRVKKIVNAVKKNEHVGLDKIVRYTQMQYYTNPGLCYAEGWAINYFFQMSDVARKKGYNTIPTRMMEELKSSGNWEKATEKVFGGLDMKKMEDEWKEFVLTLPVPKDAKGDDDPNK